MTVAFETASSASPVEETRGLLVALVGLAFVMNTMGRGVTETFAVFLLPVQEGLGASRDEIALAYSVFMVSYGCAAPFAGRLVDRSGARLTYAVGLTLLGSGYLLAGLAPSLVVYIAAVGLLGGIGSAGLGMVVASSLLSRWFTDRLGSVVALPYAASGFGVLLVPPMAQLLLDAIGWRSAHIVLGCVVIGFLAVVLLPMLPLRRMSEGSEAWRARRGAAAANGGSPRWSASAALRTEAFWALFLIYSVTAVAAYAVLPHSVACLVEQGFSPLFAAGVFGLMGLLAAFGIVAIGWASDRFGRLRAVSVSYVLTMIGIVCLMGVFAWPSTVLVYGFAICFGLMQGARGPVIVSLIARIFSGGSVGSIFGLLTFGMGLGAAFGSWSSGYLHDLTGNYQASLALALGFCWLGLMLFWLVPSLRHEHASGRPQAIAPLDPGA